MKSCVSLTGVALSMIMQLNAAWVDVHVKDAQTEDSMSGINVGAWFYGQIVYGDSLDEKYYGRTDDAGNFSFQCTNKNPEVCVFTEDLPGFYSCRLTDLPMEENDDSRLCVTLAVQRVEKPIPLYSKTARGRLLGNDFFGAGNDTISYDLVLGDWLPPQGTGTVADVVFTRYAKEDTGVHTNVVDKGWSFAVETYRYPLRVAFPGEGNGVVETPPLPGSGLRIREAPQEGYKRFVMSYWGKRGDGGNFSTWKGPGEGYYCFRIRSGFDAQGNLTGGLYGKVYSGFQFGGAMTKERSFIPIANLAFTYYLNKTPLDRNLEYDPKRNLNRNREFRRMAP